MKIRVPIQCQDVELNDREKVVAFLIYMTTIQLKAKDWPSYKLTFYRKDISHMLGGISISRLDNLRKIFDITVPNEFTLTFNWKRNSFKESIRAIIHPPSILQDINDDEAIRTYYYLLGRFSGNETVFQEGPYKSVYDKPARSLNHLTSILYNQIGLKDEDVPQHEH